MLREGDELAEHFVLKKDGLILSCISVFEIANDSYLIRKFATDVYHQRKGYGSRLFQYALDEIIRKNPKIMVYRQERAHRLFIRDLGSINVEIGLLKMEYVL